MDKDQAPAYKKEIADLYSARSPSYDDSAWHARAARKLVDLAHVTPGSRILDIATGTGMLAFYAAAQTGPQGAVLGIDIAAGMLAQAQAKLASCAIKNLRFAPGDGEALDLPPDSFDFIFCSSAFIWMSDLDAALAHWKKFLQPGGKLGLHAFAENAFITGVVAQTVLLKFGVNYLMSKPTGTVEKCQHLLTRAGFKNVAVEVDRDGAFISLADAKRAWVGLAHPAPGQFPHPLAALTVAQLADAQADYERALEKLATPEGVWNDMTTFYVFGEK